MPPKKDKVSSGSRARGRGGKRGKLNPKNLFEAPASTSASSAADADLAIAGPSSRTYEEEHALVKQSLAKTKRILGLLSPSVRQEYMARKRLKETERFLLPDSPLAKRSRNPSPPRVDCRLVVGIPTTPPPAKLQPWEIRKIEENFPSSSPANSPATPPLLKDQNTPTSATSYESTVEVPGFSPLHVDWTTRSLKPRPVVQTAPECGTEMVPPPRSPEVPPGQNLLPTQPPKPKVICGSDLLTSKAEATIQGWHKMIRQSISSDEGEEADEEPTEEDYTLLGPAIPQLESTRAEEWLAHEDGEADTHLQSLLEDHLTFEWSNSHDSFRGTRETFTGTHGPTFPVNENTKPADIFLKFFDSELLDFLVHETNQYSTRVIGAQQLSRNSRLSSWKGTNRSEMAIFITVLIFQGLCPLTVEKHYWSDIGYLTLKNFKNLMSLNRFLLLKRLLHFSDDNTPTDDIRLRKIWPLLEFLNKKFSTLYLPGQNIAIDESLLKWHGRLTFAQKITSKAAGVGIKTYELCESSTGYLWKFLVYTGKGQRQTKIHTQNDSQGQTAADGQTDDPTDRLIDETPTTSASSEPPPPSNATARIVYDLAKPLFNRGHTLIMDNFYNSPLLARYLKSHGMDCYGTLRINREFVPESIKSVAKNDLRIGEIIQSYCRDISVMVWRDTNIVSMLSTFHKGEVGGREKYGRFRYKPQIVLDYNNSMGGVDKKDQLLSAHPMERSRNQVWYKKVFRRLLNVTVLNSYIIFKGHNKNITHRAFRTQLANELVQIFSPPDVERPIPVGTKSIMTAPDRSGKIIRRPILSGNHFIGPGDAKRARCVWCKQSRTKYICKQCNVALCFEICFEEFHTVRNPST